MRLELAKVTTPPTLNCHVSATAWQKRGPEGTKVFQHASSRMTAVDFVGLEIAKGGAKERRTNATTGRPLHQIADSVLVLSGS